MLQPSPVWKPEQTIIDQTTQVIVDRFPATVGGRWEFTWYGKNEEALAVTELVSDGNYVSVLNMDEKGFSDNLRFQAYQFFSSENWIVDIEGWDRIIYTRSKDV